MSRKFSVRQGMRLLLILVAGLMLTGCNKDTGSGGGGGGNKLSKANFEKVKDGMTEKEVVDILGSPTETKDVERPGQGKMKQLAWKSGMNNVTIDLDKDGRVTSKVSIFVN